VYLYYSKILCCYDYLNIRSCLVLALSLVYSKALDTNVPTNLYSLAYSLHLRGERWSLARRYETIIRRAVTEHKTSVLMSSLPIEFFEPRYSTLNLENMLSILHANIRPGIVHFGPPEPSEFNFI
jgi:hypothetical protein